MTSKRSAKPTVYIETSVVSFAAARLARDPILRAQQLQAQKLLAANDRFALVISPAVIEEASLGDAIAAQHRLELVKSLRRLSMREDVPYLADLLIRRKALPAQALTDAVHISFATIHRVAIVASYNFRHIAGVAAQRKIETTLRQLGYDPPHIATPETILGGA